MVDQAPAGPSAQAQWEDRQLEKGGGLLRPPALRLLPDARNAQATTDSAKAGPFPGVSPAPVLYYYLPQAPQLVWDGAPVFSLTLLLSQQPGPNDTLAPLIQQGQLACDLTLAVPQEIIARLDGNASYQPLFAHDALFRLEHTDGSLIGTNVSASGTNARVGLAVTLDRVQSLAVLSALNGAASGLTICCTVRYRTAATMYRLYLDGSWAAVYDFLSKLHPGDEINATDLKSALADMVQAGIITVAQADATSATGADMPLQHLDDATLNLLLPIFLRFSAIILERLTPEFDPGDMQNRYQLRSRPDPLFRLNIRQATSIAEMRTVELSAPLEQVIGGLLDGLDRSAFLHLIAPTVQSGGPGLAPAPRLLRTRGSLGRATIAGRMQLAANGGTIHSLSLALRPTTLATPTAQQLAASDTIVSGKMGNDGVRRVAMDDVVLEKPPLKGGGNLELMPPRQVRGGGGDGDFLPIHPIDPVMPAWYLPLVDDPEAAIWHDRINPALYWYTPFFEVLQPALNQSVDKSPFLFSFVQSGATAAGKPGLNASIHFTLRAIQPATTQNKLQTLNNPLCIAVPINNLSVSFSLPFRDETGATKSQLFPATIKQEGNISTVTVDLLDDWVRLCYGAISQPNFQAQPPRLFVSYAFPGVILLPPREFELAYGGKGALTRVAFSDEQAKAIGEKPFLHAANVTFVTPVSEMHFVREMPVSVSPAPTPVPAGNVSITPPAMIKRSGGDGASAILTRSARAAAVESRLPPLTSANDGGDGSDKSPTLLQKLPVVARPDLESSDVFTHLINEPHYANQTQLHQASLDISFPCDTLGAFYLQQQSDGSTKAIGCQDALQLGQTKYRQYEEIPELAHTLYRIYRSLQQPGRFLVLPATYVITRYEPTETGKAYRPVVIVYSSVDAQNSANTRFLFEATLQPDLPPFVRRELVNKLAAYASNPLLDYPTGIESQIASSWVVDSSLNVQPNVVKSWDSFQVSFATDVSSALLFQNMLKDTGVAGNVTFTLPDGSSLQSNLSVDLRVITGPWESGPISVTLQSGSGALLTNNIGRAIAVNDVVLYQGAGAAQTIAVDKTLMAGASLSVPFTSSASEAYAAYTILPGSPADLAEVRSFVEEIHTNVIFLNLINYANHNLKKLDIVAQLKNVGGTYPVATSQEQPMSSIDLLLPLTTYLAQHVLQFQVTKTDTADAKSTTPWIEWDMTTQGVVVSLIWDMIK